MFTNSDEDNTTVWFYKSFLQLNHEKITFSLGLSEPKVWV